MIASERYFVDDTLTICVLTLPNGYKVTGESAAADPANFNETLGKKIAKDKAVAEIWPLAGYFLREKPHSEDHPPVMTCKLVLHGREQAYSQAPTDKDNKPPGRYTESPYSYERGGQAISGVSYVPDPTDPANIVLDGERLHFGAVCPPTCDPNGVEENLIFGQFTPNFNLQAHVRNAHVLQRLERGRSYKVHFVPAD